MTEKAIDKAILDLSNTIAKQIEIDDAGNIKVDKQAYLDSLKANGLDPETVKSVVQHDNSFIAACTNAVGNAAIDAFTKDKELQRVVARIPTIDRNRLSVTADRARTIRNPRTGEVSQEFGISAKYEIHGASKGSVFTTVRANLRNRAAKALA